MLFQNNHQIVNSIHIVIARQLILYDKCLFLSMGHIFLLTKYRFHTVSLARRDIHFSRTQHLCRSQRSHARGQSQRTSDILLSTETANRETHGRFRDTTEVETSSHAQSGRSFLVLLGQGTTRRSIKELWAVQSTGLIHELSLCGWHRRQTLAQCGRPQTLLCHAHYQRVPPRWQVSLQETLDRLARSLGLSRLHR